MSEFEAVWDLLRMRGVTGPKYIYDREIRLLVDWNTMPMDRDRLVYALAELIIDAAHRENLLITELAASISNRSPSLLSSRPLWVPQVGHPPHKMRTEKGSRQMASLYYNRGGSR